VENLSAERTENIRLEEIESSSIERRPVWLITLSSASTPAGSLATMREALGTPLDREQGVYGYKRHRRNSRYEDSTFCHTRNLMFDAATLIEKHRGKGVLVDTNLFVLLLVGLVNENRILNFQRTQDFTIEDFASWAL
jgi:hypothetical protein